MRFITKPWAIVCLAGVMLTGVGAALAQGNDDDAVVPMAGKKDLSGGEDVNLAPKDMLEKVRAMIPEMEKLRGAVAGQLAEAKRKNDVVKVLCLDDKVKQMKLATDTAKDRVVDLTSAVSQNDPDRSKHEFTVIQVLRGRVQALVAEAQQCIGEETGFVGNSDVTVEVDPAIPDTDTADFPDDSVEGEPPLLSSPML